ncbi:TorD/DmsD family molecular chaperone [Seleniivibrio woodruffii]|uniref:TorD/DmsD family molecular chaperone n=1 Tax=Seleniivibrio woodruffii TaxID=1078050 RepID=UPI002409FF92|nr:molecular chaperone TorD family protein [Seleniivibrio woodruffii]
MKQETAELKDYLILRKNIYHVLGHAFYKEGTHEFIEELRKYHNAFLEMFKTKNDKNIINGLHKLADAVFEDESVYRKQFARIFLSTGYAEKVKSVVPQESVYLSPAHLSMQDERDEVLKMYYEEGIGKNKDFREPDDHVTAEFHFMANLSEQAAEIMATDPDRAKSKIETQIRFLNEHINRWVPQMCDNILDMTSSDYFKAIALLTKGFIAYETATLQEISDLMN